MSELLLIRADASTHMGTGHVMRCAALAQAWKRLGGKVLFARVEATPAIDQWLRSTGFDLVRINAKSGSIDDATQLIRIAGKHKASCIVADGYHFNPDYQRYIKTAGFCLLLLDDYGQAEYYWADYLLNQNLFANRNLYPRREPYTQLLLGGQYVLLREEFSKWRNWKRETSSLGRKILVTLGGSDPLNVTGKIVENLGQIPSQPVECVVVVGGSNPHLRQLQIQSKNSNLKIQLAVNAPNMSELMAWADIGITAGGATVWEMAFMGLPFLMLVLADNQRNNVDALEAAGLAQRTEINRVAADLSALIADRDARHALCSKARQQVDGEGAKRVVARVRAARLSLRRVREDDSGLLWEWANDPATRAVSFSRELIPWEAHVEWFSQRMKSRSCLFYIASNGDDVPLGQIRYDVNEAEAVVSVSVAKEARGRGYGPALLLRGSQQCFLDSEVQLIRAYVTPNNEASVRVFRTAGYVEGPSVQIKGETVKQFTLRREALCEYRRAFD